MAGDSDCDGAHDVLVIGGGNAGISAAARLLRKGVDDVAVIEPQEVHTYRPLLSYVGGGQATRGDAERSQRSVTPRGCVWLADSVTAVDPADRLVHCASGRRYRYRDLVVVPGLVPDTDALGGIDAALATDAVASNYLDRPEATWRLVQTIAPRGRAVFTVPRPPVSCTGTTIKPLFLAIAHWRKVSRPVDVTLVIDRPRLLGVPALDDQLLGRCRELGVRVLHQTAVTALAPDRQRITVTDNGGQQTDLDYDMLHLVPPFRGPRWLEASGLTGTAPHGLVDIDPLTLQHRTFADVWAAGDAAAVDTDPSGGGLRRQIGVLVDNLLAARAEQRLTTYDGYTVAPVTTSAHRLIPGEFDRNGLAPSLPSFLDPLAPRFSAWAFDRYGLPRTYWNLILKGRV